MHLTDANRRWVGIDITHLAITLIRHMRRDAGNVQIAGRVIALLRKF